MRKRQAHFTAFLDAVGYHESAWRTRAGDSRESAAPFETLVQAAQTAERGRLDAVFFADTPGLEVFRAQYFPQVGFDALEMLPALAMKTDRIGLIASSSTTYNSPFDLARRLSTLDHISGGRAGWNIVTTRWGGAAANFGRAKHLRHDDRYERAEEFVDLLMLLWETWDSDAVIADKERGIWADVSKIRRVDFHGRFFDVAGPLPLPRSPQGRPAFAQAGSSASGIELGGRVADVIFAARPNADAARELREKVHAAARRHGRRPDEVAVLPGVSFVLGDSEAAAAARREGLEELVDSDFRWRNLAQNSGLNPELIDPDQPLSEAAIQAADRTSRTDDVINAGNRTGKTFRQVAEQLTGLPGGLEFTGTPGQFADMIENWVESGASDGFTLQPSVLPDDLEIFVDQVIPILQQKGLHRTEYTATTLRGHIRDDVYDAEEAA